MSSLPVPVSPWIRTAQSAGATVLTSSRTAANLGLDPMSSGVGTDLSVNRLGLVVSLWSADSSRFSSPFIAVLPLLVLTLPTVLPHLRPLSTDPFPDKGRTVSECCAVGFDDCQEPHRVAIDQIDVLEIDGKSAAVRSAAVRTERRTKDVQVCRFNSPT